MTKLNANLRESIRESLTDEAVQMFHTDPSGKGLADLVHRYIERGISRPVAYRWAKAAREMVLTGRAGAKPADQAEAKASDREEPGIHYQLMFREKKLRVMLMEGLPWYLLSDVCRHVRVGTLNEADPYLDADGVRVVPLPDCPLYSPNQVGMPVRYVSTDSVHSLVGAFRHLVGVGDFGAWFATRPVEDAGFRTFLGLDQKKAEQAEEAKGEAEGAKAGAESLPVKLFAFKGCDVRTVMIDGQPGFVATDVAERLGYANPAKAVSDHCDGAPIWKPIRDRLGRVQSNTRIILEPDVYALIFGSKLPEAEAFKRWVFETVLPALRKHGGYFTGEETMTDEELMARSLIVANRKLQERNERIVELEGENATLGARVERLTPKAGAAAGQLKLFDFEGAAIRILDRSGDPWFVAADVCRALGLKSHKGGYGEHFAKLDPDQITPVSDTGVNLAGTGIQAASMLINKSGVNALIMTSRKPEARRLRKWVTGTVLPARRLIRRRGRWEQPRPRTRRRPARTLGQEAPRQ